MKEGEIIKEIFLFGRDSLIKGMVFQSTADPLKIVDIGCEINFIFGERATNVDIRSLEELREASKNPNLDIPNFVQADAQHLPFEDKEYDFAVLGEILEHVDDPKQVLMEAQRVARCLVFSVPNEYEWHPSLKPFQNPVHKQLFTEPSLKKLLVDAGLKLIEFVKLDYVGWSFFVGMATSKDTQITKTVHQDREIEAKKQKLEVKIV